MNALVRISNRAGKQRATTAAILVIAVLAGCSSTQHPANAGVTGSSSVTSSAPTSPTDTASDGGSPVSGSATPSSGGSASASSASVPATSAPSGSQPSSPRPTASTSTSGSATCLSGTFSVIFPATDNPVRSACLHMGTAVDIKLLALRGVTWSTPTVSDPSVATLSEQVTPPGTRHDQVKLLRPGTVTFTSASTYNPDPHGPPSRMWTLTLTVVP